MLGWGWMHLHVGGCESLKAKGGTAVGWIIMFFSAKTFLSPQVKCTTVRAGVLLEAQVCVGLIHFSWGSSTTWEPSVNAGPVSTPQTALDGQLCAGLALPPPWPSSEGGLPLPVRSLQMEGGGASQEPCQSRCKRHIIYQADLARCQTGTDLYIKDIWK